MFRSRLVPPPAGRLTLAVFDQNAIRWPSKESWTFSGSRALVASYSSEWETCVKYARRGLIRSIASSACATLKCVGCG